MSDAEKANRAQKKRDERVKRKNGRLAKEDNKSEKDPWDIDLDKETAEDV